MLKKWFISTALVAVMVSGSVYAADYKIDNEGSHSFINFRIKHLGFSWLYGTFKTYSGTFSYDKANVASNKIMVDIDTRSLDTNHEARDKHLSSADFLDVAKYPNASFKSTKVVMDEDHSFIVVGDLTLHGVTKPVSIHVDPIGEGKDPWGNYRAGFLGVTTLKLKDFNIDTTNLGPSAAEVEMTLSIEGIRQ